MESQPDVFRQVMGHFATGISVVTTWDGAQPAGITVNAFSSVSLDPPLVMVALDRRRFITPMVRSVRRYGVSVLGADQQSLSDCFAHAPARPGELGREDFCGAAWHRGPTGLPLIDGAIATLECTVEQTFSAGDHDLFIARVDSMEQHREGVAPLLYFRRRYLRIEAGSDAPVEGKSEG
ncbi:MAG TPA: flavin reductase family protein [Candidatus Binatia bacterium]|nr:flavin reductase family protein [Candidatus Binatia bacterium]